MPQSDQLYFRDISSALDHLRDENTPLSPAALAVFSEPTLKTIQLFANAWQLISADRRRKIVQSLVDLTEDSFEANYTELFRYLLEDEDPQVRALAIDGLWEEESSILVKPLVALLRSDPSVIVRAAAATSLARFALSAELDKLTEEHAALVRESLVATIRNSEEDLEVRRRAIESVAFFGDEEVRGIVAAAYENDDPRMRASAVFAMGRATDKYWSKTILAELESNDSQVRYEATRASGELELKKAIPRLIQLTDDPDIEVANAAIAALGQIGGEEARQALEHLVTGEDEGLREAAQDSLDELTFTESANLMLIDMDLEREMLDEEELEDQDEDDEAGEPEA
ncbi:MAG TPA: HEAT repeat domain-containing protein [Anaerolineae bacterium]